jgi:hypothetical protein
MNPTVDPVNGPYDHMQAVERDLRDALRTAELDDTDASAQLWVETCLRAGVELGLQDLATIHEISHINPLAGQILRSVVVRTYNAATQRAGQPATNWRVPERAIS